MIKGSVKGKKGVLGPVISVFVLVLVVSILAGLTFLFIASLKTEVVTTTATYPGSATNESTFFNSSGDALAGASYLEARGFNIITAINGSSGAIIQPANYSVSSTGTVKNSSASPIVWANVNITYTWSYIGEANAYNAVNDTEAAGSTVVSYLSLIFLAVIFGAILTLVLRIILPYINLGKSMGGF